MQLFIHRGEASLSTDSVANPFNPEFPFWPRAPFLRGKGGPFISESPWMNNILWRGRAKEKGRILASGLLISN